MASPCVLSDLIAGREISFSRSAPLQAGQVGAGLLVRTRASNSLPQPLPEYSKIGIARPFYLRETAAGNWNRRRRHYPVPGSRFPGPRSRVISPSLGRHSMRRALGLRLMVAAGVAVTGLLSGESFAQPPAGGGQAAGATGAWTAAPVVNDLPNPYTTIEGWAKLPEGRTWGSTSAVDIDRDGKSIWVAERCAVNSCFDVRTNEMSPLNTVFELDLRGPVVA